MLHSGPTRSDEELDHRLRAALDEGPAPAAVKARGAATLAALASREAAGQPRRTLGAIRSRARRVRGAWRVAVTAAVVIVGAAALAVTLTGTPRGGQRAALSAFSVTRHGQTVDVTIQEIDSYWSAPARAAFKRALRDAGVPIVIRSHGWIYAAAPRPPAGLRNSLWCHPSPLVRKVFTDVAGGRSGFPHGLVMKIHAGQIPAGARVMLLIQASRKVDHGVHPVAFGLPGFLITASGRCLA